MKPIVETRIGCAGIEKKPPGWETSKEGPVRAGIRIRQT